MPIILFDSFVDGTVAECILERLFKSIFDQLYYTSTESDGERERLLENGKITLSTDYILK